VESDFEVGKNMRSKLLDLYNMKLVDEDKNLRKNLKIVI
jgi:hypothetical protein